jgi:hypothetical protein
MAMLLGLDRPRVALALQLAVTETPYVMFSGTSVRLHPLALYF